MRINSLNGFDAEARIAKYVANTLKAKKVSFLTQNDVYGNGFQTAVEAEFKKLNFAGQVIGTEKFAFKDTDFRVQLTSLKAASRTPTPSSLPVRRTRQASPPWSSSTARPT